MKFWIFIAFIALFVDSEACNCGDGLTPQRQFCDAHWVARTKILTTKPSSVPDFLQFDVEHVETFKTSKPIKTLPSVIYTLKRAPKCDLILENGKEYLLAGSHENGQLKVFRCAQFQSKSEDNEWEKIPEEIKNGLKSYNCSF